MFARVTENEGSVVGGLVELSNGDLTVTGRVATEDANQFAVQWEDGQISLENKADYELVVATRTAAENPAQPAGFAVPPVDAEAYPNGELLEVEMEKREETAEWEDAQNRAPIDAENPAQPAGYAVPPASGQPIPGQGADGLMTAAAVTANVYATDVTGEDGLVELSNETIQVTGKVIAANETEFVVKWEDDTNTVENKSDYNLIIANLEEDEYLDFEDVLEDVENDVEDAEVENFEDVEE